MNLSAAAGVAVREFPLETGPVDYLLYAGGKVIGVVEAKPEGHTLTGVEIQSGRYIMGVPASLPAWRRPPPFAYESTGAVTQFTNGLDPDARSREVFSFHRPEELVRLDAIRDHIAASLRIEQDELQDATPFAAMGGLGKVYQLFGDKLPEMLEELNERLAA